MELNGIFSIQNDVDDGKAGSGLEKKVVKIVGISVCLGSEDIFWEQSKNKEIYENKRNFIENAYLVTSIKNNDKVLRLD